MKTTEKQTTEFPKLHLIDLDSQFFVGIGYTPSPEEKKELGIEEDDDRPMSILGLTKDEIAGIDCNGNGRRLAQLFVAAPELLQACKNSLIIIEPLLFNGKPLTPLIEELTSAIQKATGGAR